MAETIRIDRIRCDGYGMCAEILPEVIELDDWGYPIIRPGALPDELTPLARRAVDVCPVLALKLVAAGAAQPPATVLPKGSPERAGHAAVRGGQAEAPG